MLLNAIAVTCLSAVNYRCYQRISVLCSGPTHVRVWCIGSRLWHLNAWFYLLLHAAVSQKQRGMGRVGSAREVVELLASVY